eukprot:1917591-Prymnesium_polylepis.1
MADRIHQTANVQLDNGWRQRLAKERAMAARAPPKPDPFANSLTSLISHNESDVEFLQNAPGPPVPGPEAEHAGVDLLKAHTVPYQAPPAGSRSKIGLRPGPTAKPAKGA